ncbi:MAG: DUF58 domain-containing protein [Nitrospirae bacterium]|nr:DUF58 domain-containing protein [Nitrospirota bacterium]
MRITLTREGRRFILALLVVAFAAFNTANNLMYLILGLMLSATILSLMAAYITLKGVSVDFRIEEPLYAGVKASAEFFVRNSKRYVSSYSLRIELKGIDDGAIYVERVLPGETLSINKSIVFRRRGIYRVSHIRVYTSFPFIFFVLTKTSIREKDSSMILVYPSLYDVTRVVEELISEIRAMEGIRKTIEGEEFQGLRDYQYGDSFKSIHWKATARTGTLMVKEYYEGETEKITIVLDSLRYTDRALFERAVSFVSSLSAELLGRNFVLRLVTCQKSIPPGSGREHLYKILDHLAVVEESEGISCPFTESLGGVMIMILSGPDSPLRRYASAASRVYYASDL